MHLNPDIVLISGFLFGGLGMNKTNYLVKIGVLSAIAFVLQFMGGLLPKVSGFLEIEISDFPAVIGALSLGPVAGFLIELIKNVIHLTVSTTGYVGEFANLIVNGSFVLVIGLFYKFNKTKKGAILALVMGCIIMPLSAAAVNYFIMLPLFMPTAESAAKLSLVTTTITPFNFARAIALSVITMLCYKRLSPILHK